MEPPPRKKITVKSNPGQHLGQRSTHIIPHVRPSSRSQFQSKSLVPVSPTVSGLSSPSLPVPRLKVKANSSVPDFKSALNPRPGSPFYRPTAGDKASSIGPANQRYTATKQNRVRPMLIRPDTQRIAPVDISHEPPLNITALSNRTRIKSTASNWSSSAHSDTGSVSSRVSALSVSSDASLKSGSPPVRILSGSSSSVNSVDSQDVTISSRLFEYSLDTPESRPFAVSPSIFPRPLYPPSDISDTSEAPAKAETGQLLAEQSNIKVIVDDFWAESSALLNDEDRGGSLEGSEPDLEAEARSSRKIEDLEITNRSLLAINAGLELKHLRQAQEIRDLRKRLEGETVTLSPGDSPSTRGGSSEAGGQESDDSDVDTGDPEYERVKAKLEALIESGYSALDTKREQASEGSTRVLNVEEVDL